MSGASTTGRRAVLAAIVALALVPGAAEAQRVEGSFQRTLTVGSQLDLDVTAGSGSIEVRTGPAGRVEVTGRIMASDGWVRRNVNAQERVRRIEANPPIEQSGSTVRIGHNIPQEVHDGISISYTLTVPAAAALRSKTGSGSQQIDGIGGAIDVSSGSGSLAVRKAGGSLHASTGSGGITAAGVGGTFHASTGSGSIRASDISGAITVKTSSGAIDVTQTGEGSVEASSSSGSVRLYGVRGAVAASTSSGSLTIQGALAGAWRLSTSSGSVRVSLSQNQGFELDAHSNSGSIDSDFPVTVTGVVNKRSLRGSAQGGGPRLHVRTSSGGIAISKRT
jgi:hypothetical protein